MVVDVAFIENKGGYLGLLTGYCNRFVASTAYVRVILVLLNVRTGATHRIWFERKSTCAYGGCIWLEDWASGGSWTEGQLCALARQEFVCTAGRGLCWCWPEMNAALG